MLQALYGLSGEQAEFQLRDRLSFMRFVGLELHAGEVPPAPLLAYVARQLGVAASAFGGYTPATPPVAGTWPS